MLCKEGVILPEHLPSQLAGKRPAPARPRRADTAGPQRISREELLNALQAARGKKTKAAEMLGVSRVTLWKWLKEFEVQVETGNLAKNELNGRNHCVLNANPA